MCPVASDLGLLCLPFHQEFCERNAQEIKFGQKGLIQWNKVFEILGHLPYQYDTSCQSSDQTFCKAFVNHTPRSNSVPFQNVTVITEAWQLISDWTVRSIFKLRLEWILRWLTDCKPLGIVGDILKTHETFLQISDTTFDYLQLNMGKTYELWLYVPLDVCSVKTDQTAQMHSLIGVFTEHSVDKLPRPLQALTPTLKTLIWLCNCACKSESSVGKIQKVHFYKLFLTLFCLCWGFMAQSTQWGHVERGQFT